MKAETNMSEVYFENYFYRMLTETPDVAFPQNPLVGREQMEDMVTVMGCVNCRKRGFELSGTEYNCQNCYSLFYYNKTQKKD